jgi:ParB family transcriptional regulator, chromosome partitioning protein
MTQHYNNSIFWVETDKIVPNPYQPRREFDERALVDLADSIRQYGVLQPLVVTRREIERPDGGLSVEYELIAGERRLRASRIAGLPQVPVIIRSGNEDAKMKLELAIIENLQREDLNPIDRAWAFMRLHQEFGFTHAEIGKKMGKSREYVSNSLRLLALPQDIMVALQERKISEGHTRPLMMLSDRPEEQTVLFKEIMIKKLSVREAEQYARSIAKEKVRKKELNHNPQIANYEEKLAESLGTRVHIEQREVGGKIVIDFFSPDDLDTILGLLKNNQPVSKSAMLENFIAGQEQENAEKQTVDVTVQKLEPEPAKSIFEETFDPEIAPVQNNSQVAEYHQELPAYHPSEHTEMVVSALEIKAPTIEPSYLAKNEPEMEQPEMLDDRSNDEVEQDENTDLYNVNNFTV